MTFDKPEHQQIIAQLVQQANFPGSMVEMVVDLKVAIASATVGTPATTGEAVRSEAEG